MKISNDRTLQDLQFDFQELFPNLKIEFYLTPHNSEEISEEYDRLDPSCKLGEIRRNATAGFLKVDEEQSVGDFEKMMEEMYGLNIQVFRKSYGKWLQTWATDVWSLQEQNRRGGIVGKDGFSTYEK